MLQPLAERLRPQNLDEYIGQEHLVGKGAILRRMIDAGQISSFILWGPPGVGKTTLAKIISNQLDVPFYTLSAIHSGVKDVRDVIEKCKNNRMFQTGRPILFIDEIHRFNKSQQDSLLGAVENGTVTLIGATTENPSFEVIRPLLSRCQVYVLKSLEVKNLQALLDRAIHCDKVLKNLKIKIQETNALFRYSGGDARKLLNILDLITSSNETEKTIIIDDATVTERLQQNPSAYDKGGEMHYDIISAAEDIGLANPNALLIANACFDALQNIGWPEGRIILAEATIYLASSPKSNSAYMAINDALGIVERTGNLPVPLHLRNAPTSLMKELEYGKNYKYAHDYENHFVKQQFLPDELKNDSIWKPQPNPAENKLKDHLSYLWKDRYK